MRFTGVTRVGRTVGVVVCAACAVATAIPAVAAASSTVWVSPNTVKGPFNSCATPGYNSITEAAAVNPAKTTIHVCAGTYVEQARIEKPDTVEAEPGATLQTPASPTKSGTPCDNATQQDLLTLCGAGKIKVSGLSFNGEWPTNSCGGDQIDLYVAGGSNLTLTGAKFLHAGPAALGEYGCGGGLAILVGHKSAGQTGRANLSSDTIEGYEKNGITVAGSGSSAKISSVRIQGQPGVIVGQNGIQISRGATAKISGATIEGNECGNASCGPNTKGFAGPEAWEEAEDGTGILFYEAAGGSSVKGSTINGNDIGIYNLLNSASANTTVQANALNGNRYWGIALDEGSAKVNNNVLSGPGKAGIQIVQYAIAEQFHEPSRGQAAGARGTGKADTISGMSCALEGLSDNEPGDLPASLSITKSVSKFSGNTQELCNNNTTGKLTISVS